MSGEKEAERLAGNEKMRMLDLFSGIGGFACAIVPQVAQVIMQAIKNIEELQDELA